MTFSTVYYDGNNSDTEFTIPFDYLQQSHLVVKVDDVTQVLGTDYTINDTTSKVVFTTAPASGTDNILIDRDTPNTYGELVVTFTDGSGFRAEDLNKMAKQLLYIFQEAADTSTLLQGYSVIDDDTMATASATTLSTSESILAYIDSVAGVGFDMIDDTTPQLGADLDTNGFSIQFDDGEGLRDDSDNEQIVLHKTASAVNQVGVTNAATGTGPTVAAEGDDTNIDLNIDPKGSGAVVIDGLSWPTADGSVDQVLRTDGAGTLSFVDQSGSSITGGFKNKILNGNFDVWQRATSFPSIAAFTVTADGWEYVKAGAAVHNLSRSTDVPPISSNSILSNYSLLVDCTTADTTISSTDYTEIRNRIEGIDWASIAQREVTLSFWVKATKTGTYCVSLRNSGVDRSYVADYTVDSTNTWEKKTITISASPSTGTWYYTPGTLGLLVGFTLAAGSSYQATSGVWSTGNFLGSTSQVNATDSVSNDFRIAQVQLELGPSATEFESRSYQEQLQHCQRYYELLGPGMTGIVTSSTTCRFAGPYKVDKAKTPTLSLYDSSIAVDCPGVEVDVSSGSSITASVNATEGVAITVDGFTFASAVALNPLIVNQTTPFLAADAGI